MGPLVQKARDGSKHSNEETNWLLIWAEIILQKKKKKKTKNWENY